MRKLMSMAASIAAAVGDGPLVVWRTHLEALGSSSGCLLGMMLLMHKVCLVFPLGLPGHPHPRERGRVEAVEAFLFQFEVQKMALLVSSCWSVAVGAARWLMRWWFPRGERLLARFAGGDGGTWAASELQRSYSLQLALLAISLVYLGIFGWWKVFVQCGIVFVLSDIIIGDNLNENMVWIESLALILSVLNLNFLLSLTSNILQMNLIQVELLSRRDKCPSEDFRPVCAIVLPPFCVQAQSAIAHFCSFLTFS